MHRGDRGRRLRRPFADHAVIITGASSGIGAELARQLADQGAWLALASRRAHELDLVAQECISRGGRALVIPADVTDPAQCTHIVARTLEAYHKVDILVNNAGLGAHFTFADVTDLTVFERVMRVNYLGSVYCTHAALPHLKATRGRIVAVTSLAGRTGVPQRSAYAASKFAMQGFFDSIRVELKPTGVTVSVISPGFVQSEIRRNALGADGQPLGESHLDESTVMGTEDCVRQVCRAIERRQRDLVMWSWPRTMALVKAVAPGVVDDVAARAIASGRHETE